MSSLHALDGTDAIWPALVSLRRALRTTNAPGELQFWSDGSDWHLDPAGRTDRSARYVIDIDLEDPAQPAIRSGESAPVDVSACLLAYLPIIVGAWRARCAGRSFVVAHVAQTLDGRIACHNGHSQWISNEANLHHAHRLRALLDGVLVGGRTVAEDDPALTVRHVEGDNPERVVVSRTTEALRTQDRPQVFRGAGATYVYAKDTADVDTNGAGDEVRLVPIDAGEDGSICPHSLSKALFERGVTSLFVEGGGLTVSKFLRAGALDLLHVHVAPRILGSGVQSFTLPEVGTIDESTRLEPDYFTVGDELMLSCRLPSREVS